MARKKQENAKILHVFEVWYSQDRHVERTRDILSKETPPIRLSTATVNRYINNFGWHERANGRDAEVARRLSEEAIEQQVAFRKRQAQTGLFLQQKGLTFLRDDKLNPNDPNSTGTGGIKSDYAAIQAIRLGLDLEKVGMGMPERSVGIQGDVGGEVVIRVVREEAKKKNVPDEKK